MDSHDIDSALKSPTSLYGWPHPGSSCLSPETDVFSRERMYRVAKEKQYLHQHKGDESPTTSSIQSSSLREPPAPLFSPNSDRESGIDWTLAVPALSLLSNARYLVSQPITQRQTKQIRRFYLDAVAYLLKSLPEDLTPLERANLSECIPYGLRGGGSSEQQIEKVGTSQKGILHFDNEQTLFRRTVAQFLVLMAMLTAMILPHILGSFQWAYQQERKYKVTNRLLLTFRDGANTFGEKCLDMRDWLLALRHGRFGSSIDNTIAYFLDGVLGGFHDGISRGMVVVKNALIR